MNELRAAIEIRCEPAQCSLYPEDHKILPNDEEVSRGQLCQMQTIDQAMPRGLGHKMSDITFNTAVSVE